MTRIKGSQRSWLVRVIGRIVASLHGRREFSSLCICILLLAGDIGDAIAQSILLSIDKPAPDEKSQVLKRYFPKIDIARDTLIYFVEFEGFNVFRVQKKDLCISDKCLTIVIRSCGDDACPHVNFLAEPYVYSTPMYIELIGGLRMIVFGQPGRPGPALMYGKDILIVTSIP